ncbi:B45 [miniopterid betaherpesvirus 1]|uniref:B45 n=1 Tax=miniopterid betaherpesvirus 1 TaxID=3070189 RepID=I3VQ31_9BETA|nr:B45 [miniopterid betaherpesvirus 1]AFK83875.1 B45 [miniopterid betaherpesvirus 1]
MAGRGRGRNDDWIFVPPVQGGYYYVSGYGEPFTVVTHGGLPNCSGIQIGRNNVSYVCMGSASSGTRSARGSARICVGGGPRQPGRLVGAAAFVGEVGGDVGRCGSDRPKRSSRGASSADSRRSNRVTTGANGGDVAVSEDAAASTVSRESSDDGQVEKIASSVSDGDEATVATTSEKSQKTKFIVVSDSIGIAVSESPPEPLLGRDAAFRERFYKRLCLCHKKPSRTRLCRVSKEPCDDCNAVAEHVCALCCDPSLSRSGEFHKDLMTVILSAANDMIVYNPRLSQFLGHSYAYTVKGLEVDPVGSYIDETIICPEVSRFYSIFGDMMREPIKIVGNESSAGGSNGLYPAVLFFDGLASCIRGRYETYASINARVAATIACKVMDADGEPLFRVLRCGTKTPVRIFERFLRSMGEMEASLSLQAMANAGFLDKAPLGDGVIGRSASFDPEAMMGENARVYLRAMNGGVPVSVNVTRTAADSVSMFEYLRSQCSMIRRSQRIRTAVCVYADIWHESFPALLEHAMALDASAMAGVTLAVNVPDIFLKRCADAKKSWTLFDSTRSERLLRGSGYRFQERYEELEAKDGGTSVSATGLLDTLCRLAAQGSVGIVFVDSVCRYGVLSEAHAGATYLGPDMSSVGLGPGSVTTYSAHVNLCGLVMYGRPAEKECFAVNGRYIDLEELRDLVTNLVVELNAIMDLDLAGESVGVIPKHVQRYRSLSVGVMGLYSMFAKMRLPYENPKVDLANRVIFENIFYAAVRASVDLCMAGAPKAPGFDETEYSRGIFPFDKYRGVSLTLPEKLWISLRQDMMRFGMRNCQLLSLAHREDVANCFSVSGGISPMEAFVRSAESPFPLGEGVDEIAPGEFAGRGGRAKSRDVNEAARFSLPIVDGAYRELPAGEEASISEKQHDAAAARNGSPFASGYAMSWKRTLDLCARRAPFVDQGQAPVFHLRGKDRVSDVAEWLTEAHRLGLKVAFCKCRVRDESGK